MPNWQPNWEDVHWNYAEADAAAAQLNRDADALDRTSGAWQLGSNTATGEWRGVYRRRFDQELTGTLADAWRRAGEFRETAARIRRATQWARDEQAHRERERERWRREKAEEDARHAREQRAREERQRLAQSAG